jgi:hypothetical protein
VSLSLASASEALLAPLIDSPPLRHRVVPAIPNGHAPV